MTNIIWRDEPILSAPDIARIAGVDASHIRHEIADGHFPPPLIGTGKNRRWSIRQVEAWLDTPGRGNRSTDKCPAWDGRKPHKWTESAGVMVCEHCGAMKEVDHVDER
jgi:predicted DNA-binding transcriptional regulator AlpA